jgi:hypothetical protein
VVRLVGDTISHFERERVGPRVDMRERLAYLKVGEGARGCERGQ